MSVTDAAAAEAGRVWTPVPFASPLGGTAVGSLGNYTITPANAGQPVFSDLELTLNPGDKLELVGLIGGASAPGQQWGGLYVDTAKVPTGPNGTVFSYSKEGNQGQVALWLLGAGGDNYGSLGGENNADPSELYASVTPYWQNADEGAASFTARRGGAGVNGVSTQSGLKAGSKFYVGVFFSVPGSYGVQGLHYRILKAGGL